VKTSIDEIENKQKKIKKINQHLKNNSSSFNCSLTTTTIE
jgi:hypothetical protein